MHKKTITTNFSFWETQTFFKDIDLIVIGSGIVGLNAAISYQEKHKKAKILVLERGVLPHGASTKNAGFACFGSVSELLSDIKKTSEDFVWQTVDMRIKGLELLRKRLGDQNIDYKEFGGYELFNNVKNFEECCGSIDYFNKKIKPYTGIKNTYSIQNKKIKNFQFKQVKGLIWNRKEGQIDTGKMMQSLIQLALSKGIIILNSINVNGINDTKTGVDVETSIGLLQAKRVVVATNGFAAELLKREDVKPARAQVLITKPIEGLKIKGTFHYDEGYFYFRNIGKRVLFGGGRNLDFEKETSSEFVLNEKIHRHLETLLKTTILPGVKFEIEQRWCGIMGVGNEKKPIIKKVSSNVVCAVRMGGMGVAIGSLVGQLAVNEF
ncbi:MAG: FAD-dependent oxidoreductase [Bacteroidetes bacterium]|jgi:glycine/D-amino acid oxidase-like deaminating enzyme|nr:FAD-dependent oxidoreductase [Bacteroidota bacterium]MDF2451356.1 FAD-dependent oxidoreductase [Bacteroidota bacterium]